MKIRYFMILSITIHNSVMVMVFVLLTHWHIFPAIRWWWWRYSLWLESVPFGPPCPALCSRCCVYRNISGWDLLALMCRNECIPICRQIAGHRSNQTLCSRATPPSGGECVDIFRYIYRPLQDSWYILGENLKVSLKVALESATCEQLWMVGW